MFIVIVSCLLPQKQTNHEEAARKISKIIIPVKKIFRLIQTTQVADLSLIITLTVNY